MIQNLIKNAKRIHFIGIGGIGVSAIAKICFDLNIHVSGSDLTENQQTLELKSKGIDVTIGHHANNLKKPDLVIYSLAIPKTNPELLAAAEQGVKLLSYPESLGELTKGYKLIAVAGTHGKTTTTGMLAKILIEAGLDPTIIIGTTVDFLKHENYRLGNSEYFLLEACEYYAGFLNLHPTYTLITNVEHDHFDSYPTEESYLEAFQQLIDQTKNTVILNTDFALSQKLKTNSSKTITFNESTVIPTGLNVPGIHNQINATGALLLSQKLGLEINNSKQSLLKFNGTDRRLQFIKESNGQLIYDDYGHHPTEIKATLQAIKEKYPEKTVCLIYQAHQHNRTIALLDRFIDSFTQADKIIIPDIYAARDSQSEKHEMTAETFANKIKTKNPNTIYTGSLEETGKNLKSLTSDSDIVLIMGAGDIYSKLEPYL
jgi:UDP-N-acetylmuramate--alanine ligase